MSSPFDVQSFVDEVLSGIDFGALFPRDEEFPGKQSHHHTEHGDEGEHDDDHAHDHGHDDDDDDTEGPVFAPHPYVLDEPVSAKPEGKGGGNGGEPGGGGGKGKTGKAPTDIKLSSSYIDENSPGGAAVGQLSATDADKNETFIYKLIDSAGGRFELDGDMLVVANGATLDFETDKFHEITVEVTDKYGNTYVDTLHVTINDLAEGQNQAPTGIALDSIEVVENAADGAVVGALDSSDPDAGDSATYSLLDDAGGRFAINGDHLVVADGSLLDYETAASHSITVQVTDSGGATYTEQFTIQLTNVDESVQEKPYYVSALVPQSSNGEEYYRWNYGDDVGMSVVVTFTFLDDFASYYDSANMHYTNYTNDPVAFEAFTAAQVTVTYQLLAEIAEFSNVIFVEVGTAEEADITFGAYYMDSGIGAYAYYAGGGSYSGDVWMNTRYDQYPTTSEDGGADWARSALAHEIGHAMGLQHPGDYDAGSGGTGELYLPANEDNGQFTIMSYTDYPYSSYDPVDYMLYDIAALQYLYGANTSHATGDDVYAFDEHAKYIDTIWDAGGFDTFSAASANGDVTLDLNEGAFSSVGLIGNIGIAFGAQIEAAIGGAGDDTLIGNDLDNVLTGGDGADWLFGGAGSDKFVFDEADGFDVIADFEDGFDLIDLSGSALTYDELGFSEDATGVDIVFGDTTVTLADATLSQIGADDFLLAEVA